MCRFLSLIPYSFMALRILLIKQKIDLLKFSNTNDFSLILISHQNTEHFSINECLYVEVANKTEETKKLLLISYFWRASCGLYWLLLLLLLFACTAKWVNVVVVCVCVSGKKVSVLECVWVLSNNFFFFKFKINKNKTFWGRRKRKKRT